MFPSMRTNLPRTHLPMAARVGARLADSALALALVVFALVALPLSQPAAAESSPADLAPIIDAWRAGDFDAKAAAASQLAATGHPRTVLILQALLDGNLVFRKADDRVAIAQEEADGLRLSDAFTGEDLAIAKKRAVTRITLNNSLRQRLRSTLAQLNLSSPDPAARLAAVRRMLNEPDPETTETLRRLLAAEPDVAVREALATAVAVAELAAGDAERRLAAVTTLSGALQPEVRRALTGLIGTEQDPRVLAAAQKALRSIDSRVRFYGFVETLFFGLSLGSVLVLAAIGLAITFGVMGVINMAHGELIMLGAYTTYVVQTLMPSHVGTSLLVAIPAAFLVAGLAGILIERTVIRFLYGRPLETLLATFGVSLILQQAVRSIFSPLNRSVETPAWMSGSLEINSVLSLTLNRLYILLFCLLVFAALALVLKRTSLGLRVRAVSQNRPMARAMGVRAEWVDALTFGLGSGIAGIAGVALSQLTNVGPNLGQAYIVDSFMVVVFGGVGNLWGTLIGGLSLGVANKIMEPWAGAVLAKILILVLIILFIQKRPRGLFPQRGRAAEG
jgi:urea transport system permease protein